MENEISIDPTLDDIPYEDDITRNPYNVNTWLRYLEFKTISPQPTRNFIYERALREIPRSYKIWHKYLQERTNLVRGKCIQDSSFELVNSLFERSLVYLNKMPRLWLEYCEFLISQKKITQTRRTFDRALRALPITQHPRIWELYLKFIKSDGIPIETCISVYKRYLKIHNENVEDYIEFLVSLKAWNEVAEQLLDIINRDNFNSTKGKTKHDLWLQLCDILSSHPREIGQGIQVDAIIRAGINAFTDQQGKLWASLADYYIRLAQFEKARDIFEEALETVPTARDFSFIWDSYTQFEDSIMSAKQEIIMDSVEEKSAETMEQEQIEFDMMLERYENLITRQPLLLNSVLLRQNPNNVPEWHKRVRLLSQHNENGKKVDNKVIVDTYSQALSTVDPQKVKGKFFTLWAAFAHFYEHHGQLEKARQIFESATKVNFRTVDELASLWCEYAEMELRHKCYEKALDLLKRATVSPRKAIQVADSEPVQKRVFKSTKLWSFYVDLEESFGTFHSTKSIYDKMIQLKVITPQILLNYTEFLEQNKYFEESFKVYEQGIGLFPFPHVQYIWITYLNKFINRYGGLKLERTRDLFEQVLSVVPLEDSKIFFLMYANYEEKFGLARHSMSVYDRAAKSVHPNDRFNIYLLYILRAAEYFGINQTRDIFTKAIEALPDKFSREMCLKFAVVERKYGEIDRARAIYIHGAQYSDPRTCLNYWKTWEEFERDHGNEDTFRDLIRLKKSVLTQYNSLAPILNLDKINEQTKQQKQQEPIQTHSLKIVQPVLNNISNNGSTRATKNDDEIDIDEDDADEEENEIEIETKQIPKAVISSNIK
ncbi:TPR-like helical domain-containing protein [Tieghemostelium lacteum]|uniref:Pre-mRNA-splicing factor SYF1 n=1 Tax=Tieghemostelium lacteum TaxID=361077 RepID=A0A151ZI60_TIELA|nr:TPR-like helical domain-containing protein [Tieghemostelium lacteum]|eukprot:KYQ93672.1 TPR-like helical domain-containing protein [Tieghemostelium lacteum]